MRTLPPRVVVAGTSSGVGKTTVATGLMAAFGARGVVVAGAKVGPDFIDTGYHRLATNRPSRNLDPWICGRDAMAPMAAKASEGAELLIVEGVMGLFDGAFDAVERGELAIASTAQVARELMAPVLLVVDAAAMNQSVAALVSGFARHHRDVEVAGVVLNRVGSPSHEDGLRRALEPLDLPVVGCLHRDDSLAWRDRHLGLVPVVEEPQRIRASLDHLASMVAGSVDLDAVSQIASSAAELSYLPLPPSRRVVTTSVPVAVAAGPAFSFAYPDNLERLTEAGAELVPFDPTRDEALPDGVVALYAGGGFPEVYAPELASRTALLHEVRTKIAGGMVTWAECGGLLWLAEALGDVALAGAVATRAEMTRSLTLGYRTALVRTPNPVAATGAVLRGHEFHYSTCHPRGSALELSGRQGVVLEGHASPTLLATYLHLHLGSDSGPAERFVEHAAASS